jgi:hypothetical protein
MCSAGHHSSSNPAQPAARRKASASQSQSKITVPVSQTLITAGTGVVAEILMD